MRSLDLRTRRAAAATVVVAVLVTVGGVAIADPFRGSAAASPSPTMAALASPTGTTRPTATPTRPPTPSPTVDPLTLPVADLTGERVDLEHAHRLPMAVLIDDNRVARPQSGFNGASLVFQAPADGGETRYLMVFQEGESADVGPVRSGRVYFVHWASEVRAAIAHYGGDKVSRDYFKAHDRVQFTDIDALRTASRPFHRIATRVAPHNAYTDTVALRDTVRRLGGPQVMPAELFRRPFVDASALDARGTTQSIRVPYRTGLVEYAYDRAANAYVRSLDGRDQIDPADGKPVTTRNVVVLFMSFRTDATIEPGHNRPVVGDIGTGRALVFREGRAVEGSWRKADETSPTRLFDAAGSEIPLVRGRTFFQIVPADTAVGHR